MPGDMNYCARCGAPLAEQHEAGTDHPVLVCTNPACGQVSYRNAKPCAGVLVEHAGQVLLVQRAIEPYKGCWDIPGGFLHEWEHPAEGAVREVQEETGLEVRLTALLGIFMDRYGSADYNTLNIYYRGAMVGGTLQAADDAAALAWFAPDALPADLAFPDHEGQVLAVWRAAVARDPRPAPDSSLAVFVAPALAAQQTRRDE
jgi:8-oxo-dGTP diphosphatase